MPARSEKKGQSYGPVPYDYKGGCNEAPDASLGVPYFNWIPGYKQIIEASMNGNFKQQFFWLGPDWKDINNAETSSIGFPENSRQSA